MNKKTILLDVDEVICFGGFLDAANEFLNTSYVIDDFTDYYIDEVIVPKERFHEFNAFLKEKNLYENALNRMLPGAVDAIKKLNDKYEIYILSSCVNPFDLDGSARLFQDKYSFLRKALPFLNPKNFIFTSAKHLFKADIQIDDCTSNFSSSVTTKILFPSYHNKELTSEELEAQGIVRAGIEWKEGWKEVLDILLER